MNEFLPEAATVLSTWIDADLLESRVDTWLDEMRNPETNWMDEPGVTWYTRLLKNEGRAAADTAMNEYAAKLRANVSAIPNIANGIHALCQTDPETRRGDKYVSVVERDSLRLPGYRPESSLGQAIVILNPEVPGCGCTQPKGSYLFGKYGTLGLKAVVLYVDPIRPQYSSLNLALASRRKGAPDAAYAVLEFDLRGIVNTHEVSPELYSDGPLMADLGRISKEQAWGAILASGGIADSVLGPGCLDYIVSNLADLGSYLEAVADQLSAAHKH